jgi:hypothetical protein
MKKLIRLSEKDLTKLISGVIKEQSSGSSPLKIKLTSVDNPDYVWMVDVYGVTKKSGTLNFLDVTERGSDEGLTMKYDCVTRKIEIYPEGSFKTSEENHIALQNRCGCGDYKLDDSEAMTESYSRYKNRLVSEQRFENKPQPCPKDLTIVRQMLSTDTQLNIKVDSRDPRYVIMTPMNTKYPPFVCLRNQIFKLS